jgi:hypothetical protein
MDFLTCKGMNEWMNELSSHCNGYDEIQQNLIKISSSFILSPLNYMFNKLLSLCIFLKGLKYSKINPIYKKKKKKATEQMWLITGSISYDLYIAACIWIKWLLNKIELNWIELRLISLLTSSSKIFETIIFNRVQHHFDINNILAHEQYGFWLGHLLSNK